MMVCSWSLLGSLGSNDAAELFLPGCMSSRDSQSHAPLRPIVGCLWPNHDGGGQRRSLARSLLRRTVPPLMPRGADYNDDEGHAALHWFLGGGCK